MDFDEAASKYFEDGYAIIEDFLSQDEVNEMKQRMYKILDGMNPKEHSTVFSTTNQTTNDYFIKSADRISFFFEENALDNDGNLLVEKHKSVNKVGHALHCQDPVFTKISQSDKIKAVAKALKLADPVICQSMYIFKQPKIGGVVVPHQDASFMKTIPNSLVGFWIPLQDARIDNSCIWVLPGSHKEGVHNDRYFGKNPDKSEGAPSMIYTHDAKEYDDSDFVAAEMKAGSLLLIHGEVVHKSAANTSEHSRHAYTFHLYESKNVEYSKDNWLQPTEANTFVHLFASS